MNIFLKLKKIYGNQILAAAALGIADSTLSDWINGKKIPKANRVRAIQDSHGFSDTEMMDSLYPRDRYSTLENNNG